jgi:hypothetical protein
LTDEERWAGEHDGFGPVEAPDDWRLVWLRMEKPNGGDLQIELLRPVDWLDGYEVQVGAEIDLDLEELGADGPATVLAIHRCPQILPRPGPGYQLVTGRFAHANLQLPAWVLGQSGQKSCSGIFRTASLNQREHPLVHGWFIRNLAAGPVRAATRRVVHWPCRIRCP